MKIAVMADIHSNHVALERCIEEAKGKGAEEYLFLGDYIGELAYPERTIQCLKDIANEISYSPRHTARLIKSIYGCSITELRKKQNNATKED